MMYGPKNTVTPGKDLVETKQNKVDFVRILILIQIQTTKRKTPSGCFSFCLIIKKVKQKKSRHVTDDSLIL